MEDIGDLLLFLITWESDAVARPRKDSTEPSARERILNAFWDLMNEMPYKSITVAALIKRAGVSPNTLYAHFDGYQNVVQAALDETLEPDLLPILVSDMDFAGTSQAAMMAERLDKVILFASDDSGELSAMLKKSLLQTWLKALGLSKEKLSPLEAAELDFIFAGVVSMLSKKSAVKLARNKELMRHFFQRPLGNGVLSTIDALRTAK